MLFRSELYSLIGPSAPSLAASQLSKPRLKQKPNLGGGGRVKWCVPHGYVYYLCIRILRLAGTCRVWQSFKNNARNDSLRLSHWAKAGTDPEDGAFYICSVRYRSFTMCECIDYKFAVYNVQPNSYSYTHEEYTKWLVGAYSIEYCLQLRP